MLKSRIGAISLLAGQHLPIQITSNPVHTLQPVSVRIYAICLIKNEADVIADCLKHALQFCDRIFVLDNGSTDGTWQIVNSLADHHHQIIIEGQASETFRDGMRSIVYNRHHQELSDQDWWLRLDADEFLVADPRPTLAKANREHADFVTAWQLQFYYTDADFMNWEIEKEIVGSPITERRRYYSINWREYRFFRNQRDVPWNEATAPQWPNGLTRVCSERVFNRHYSYRTPDQIQSKLKSILGHAQFKHVGSGDWRSRITPANGLHYYQEGKPPILNRFNYYTKRLRMVRITLCGRAKRFLHRFS